MPDKYDEFVSDCIMRHENLVDQGLAFTIGVEYPLGISLEQGKIRIRHIWGRSIVEVKLDQVDKVINALLKLKEKAVENVGVAKH